MSALSEQSKELTWRKAKLSQGASNCVELAETFEGEVAMRNSRDPDGPVLRFTREEVAAFLDGAKKQEFDDLALRRSR